MALIVVKKSGGDYTTINDALDNANADDTVEVQDSEVYEEPTITFHDNGITLQAGEGYSPIIDGSSGYSEGFQFAHKTGITIRGFEIRKISNSNEGGFEDQAYGALIEDCLIHSCYSFTHPTNPLLGSSANPVIFRRCRLIQSESAMTLGTGNQYVEFENCLFDYREVGGSVLPGIVGLKVRFCTFLQDDSFGHAVFDTDAEVWNSVAINVNAGAAGNVGFNADNVYHCAAQGYSTNIATVGDDENNLDGDNDIITWDESSVFVDFDNGDYTPAGVLLSAGLALPSITTDLSGTLRNDPPDIGAYEVYVPPPAVAAPDNRLRISTAKQYKDGVQYVRLYQVVRRN